MCGEDHVFHSCPQLPKGISFDERRSLMFAGRDGNEARKSLILARVLDRLEQENALDQSHRSGPVQKTRARCVSHLYLTSLT